MQQARFESTGTTLLKLSGTLMLIFGILGVLIYAAFTAVLIAANHLTGSIFSGSRDIIGMAILLAAAAAELVSGSLGLKAAKRPIKARRCPVWGVLTLVLTLTGILLILFRMPSDTWWEAALAAAFGVVTPVVYLIGAVRCIKDWHSCIFEADGPESEAAAEAEEPAAEAAPADPGPSV